MATFTLAGELRETRFSQESASTTKHLLQAWVRRCSEHFGEYRRRYELIKAVGVRSFPAEAKPAASIIAHEDSDCPATVTVRFPTARAAQRSVSLRQRFEVQTLLRAASAVTD